MSESKIVRERRQNNNGIEDLRGMEKREILVERDGEERERERDGNIWGGGTRKKR